MSDFSRITQDLAVMGGKPWHDRRPARSGSQIDELLADYPYLQREDILEAVGYEAWRAQEREVVC